MKAKSRKHNLQNSIQQHSQINSQNYLSLVGYVLTCVAYPQSDIVIEVGELVEQEFYNVFNEEREQGIDYK